MHIIEKIKLCCILGLIIFAGNCFAGQIPPGGFKIMPDSSTIAACVNANENSIATRSKTKFKLLENCIYQGFKKENPPLSSLIKKMKDIGFVNPATEFDKVLSMRGDTRNLKTYLRQTYHMSSEEIDSLVKILKIKDSQETNKIRLVEKQSPQGAT